MHRLRSGGGAQAGEAGESFLAYSRASQALPIGAQNGRVLLDYGPTALTYSVTLTLVLIVQIDRTAAPSSPCILGHVVDA